MDLRRLYCPAGELGSLDRLPSADQDDAARAQGESQLHFTSFFFFSFFLSSFHYQFIRFYPYIILIQRTCSLSASPVAPQYCGPHPLRRGPDDELASMERLESSDDADVSILTGISQRPGPRPTPRRRRKPPSNRLDDRFAFRVLAGPALRVSALFLLLSVFILIVVEILVEHITKRRRCRTVAVLSSHHSTYSAPAFDRLVVVRFERRERFVLGAVGAGRPVDQRTLGIRFVAALVLRVGCRVVALCDQPGIGRRRSCASSCLSVGRCACWRHGEATLQVLTRCS